MTEKGHYRCYVPKVFSHEHLVLIGQANSVIEEYEKQNLSLTLRQLYYQFVARDWIENKLASYNRLGSVLSDARLAGLVSWTAIEDRTRNLQGLNYHRDPAGALRQARSSFRLDLWRDQDWYPEVWIEKEALVGVVEGICAQLRVNFFACRGYNSQSEQWRAGRRLAGYAARGQRPIVFHLGDHDPSGIDMTRDNRDRLSLFAGTPIQVVRLALNMPQIEEHNPPPNPAKVTDSRYEGYRAEYGEESWELDALSPALLRDLIRGAVEALRDPVRWDDALAEEAEGLRFLDEVIEQAGGGDDQEA